jgi:hypothetical protein
MTTLTKRPQTAIISKAAKYAGRKREREEEDAKARARALLKWERVKKGEVVK